LTNVLRSHRDSDRYQQQETSTEAASQRWFSPFRFYCDGLWAAVKTYDCSPVVLFSA
jgi:hypothetical protein